VFYNIVRANLKNMDDYTIYTETYILSSTKPYIKVFEQVSKVELRHKNIKCNKHPNYNSITLNGMTKEIKVFLYELSIRDVNGLLDRDS